MSEGAIPLRLRPWRRPMTARDPAQHNRAATPLELLFDLAFVVAIARAAAEMHHAIAERHVLAGIVGYLVVFFAIWWAWMNFTWFASAYDTDDGLYRVLAAVQMTGVLVLAVGVPGLFTEFDVTVPVVGYVIMRLSMVAQWLRAARGDPARARTCRTYAAGIAVIQILWVALIVVPVPAAYVGFAVLAVAELAVPPWAESRGGATTWHAEHIAERYGLLTIIVLGEVILAVTNALGSAVTTGEFSIPLVLLAVAGMTLVISLWWTYFLGGDHARLTTLRTALAWGYGHYFVFGAVAAVGAGLEAAVDTVEPAAPVGPLTAAFSVAVPVVVFLVTLTALRALSWPPATVNPTVVAAGCVLLLAVAGLAGVLGVGLAVLLMSVVLAGALAAFLVLVARRGPPAPRDNDPAPTPREDDEGTPPVG